MSEAKAENERLLVHLRNVRAERDGLLAERDMVREKENRRLEQ